jgi:hypothetical protein
MESKGVDLPRTAPGPTLSKLALLSSTSPESTALQLAQTIVPPSALPPPIKDAFQVHIYAERAEGLVTIGQERPLLSGDVYAFYVNSPVEAYVGVYELDESGALTRLYPPSPKVYAAARDFRVNPAQLTRVPPASEGDLVVDDRLGTERLTFVQSTRPLMDSPDAHVARAVKMLASWPSNWTVAELPKAAATASTHTVRVRGSWFAPRAAVRSTEDFLVAATFFEIVHTK